MKIVATCSVVAALIVFGYLVAESQMLSYLSSEPEVCITCHTMNTHLRDLAAQLSSGGGDLRRLSSPARFLSPGRCWPRRGTASTIRRR